MKALLVIILLTLPACTTIQVTDAGCTVETVRKAVVECGEARIATGEVLMDGDTVTSVAKEVGEVIK